MNESLNGKTAAAYARCSPKRSFSKRCLAFSFSYEAVKYKCNIYLHCLCFILATRFQTIDVVGTTLGHTSTSSLATSSLATSSYFK